MYNEFIKKFRDLLHNSLELFWEHLLTAESFMMSYKLELHTVMMLIIKKLTRSIQIELGSFFYYLGDLDWSASKSAFSQARDKIKWTLFKSFNQSLLKLLGELGLYGYPSTGRFKKVAIDGFNVRLPQKEELKKAFGSVKNQHSRKIAMADAAVAYDLETGYAIVADIDKYEVSEKAIVEPWLSQDYFDEETLLIYDRFYLGYGFAYQHLVNQFHYVMRVRKNWNKATIDFIASDSQDQIVTIRIPESALTQLRKKGYNLTGKHEMQVRLTKGLDNKGKEVFYATDILDKEVLSKEEIHQYYARRWEVETAIDAFKNKLQLECFTGHKELIVRQDFYAAICSFNISKVVHNHAMEELIKKTQDKENKKMEIGYEPKVITKENIDCQPNHNLIIGALGFSYFDLLNPEKDSQQIYQDMIQFIVRFPEKIRKGRSYSRKSKYNRRKGRWFYQPNYKRAL